jgi:SP family sugar:H+ symporter-like MFS transporter
MYQGEGSPTHVRGAIICCYRLFITIGILIACLINFGTESIESPASWRIVMDIGFVFAFVLGFGILLFPETPRFDHRQGKIDKAADSISKFYGVRANHIVVGKQMKEMEQKFQAEQEGGDHPWYEVLTGRRMLYRVAILALQ